MKTMEVVRYQQRLNNLFSQVEVASGGDLELQSHWARYLCVLVSGFLEVSVREIFSDFARRKSWGPIANFVEDHIEGFQNANMEKILQVVKSFNPVWEQELRRATEGELKEAVDSIVANRHKIAHGQSVGITLARLKRYYEKATEVVELLETICEKA